MDKNFTIYPSDLNHDSINEERDIVSHEINTILQNEHFSLHGKLIPEFASSFYFWLLI